MLNSRFLANSRLKTLFKNNFEFAKNNAINAKQNKTKLMLSKLPKNIMYRFSVMKILLISVKYLIVIW